jgi:CubicO group peptidase (beta-lactamase class C family)
MPEGVTPEHLGNWDWIVSRIAELEPVYEPGTTNAYLPLTFGWVLGEVVRRTDPRQRPFGQFLQDEVCTPLGIDSLWLGVPAPELHRGAWIEQAPSSRPASAERAAVRTRVVPPAIELIPGVYNRDDVRQACIPATGVVANARSLARLFALFANGGALGGTRLLSPERVRSFTRRRTDYESDDRTNFAFMPVGAMGYWLADPSAGDGPDLICSVGAGGAVTWADLETGLAVSICHTRMFSGLPPGEHWLAPVGEAVRSVAKDLNCPSTS